MKILVPLDGSKLSETILGRVAQLAEATDSEVILLSVVEEPRIGGTWLEALATVDETTGEFGMAGTSYLRRAQLQSDAVTETRDQAMERAIGTSEEYLGQVAAAFPSLKITTRAVHGDDPVTEIMAVSQAEDIDLIAMSTRGHSGLGRWVYGSNADKLLHSTSIPLLLLRPGEDRDEPLEKKPIDTLLVPLDGSALAESSMPHVEALAKSMGLKISLVQVITTPTMAYPATESYAFDPQMAANLERAAAGYLKERQTELEQKGLQVETTVKNGYPAAHIIDLAAESEGRLIVMSTHGRSGLGRWIMGSVADRVLRASFSPVLLIRPQE
jgi:nucleotide-binding universal stress UspA family protein